MFRILRSSWQAVASVRPYHSLKTDAPILDGAVDAASAAFKVCGGVAVVGFSDGAPRA